MTAPLSSEKREGASHPDQTFTDWHHAFVVGLVAAELMSGDAFRIDIDSGCPVIGLRFGTRRYEVIVRELQ